MLVWKGPPLDLIMNQLIGSYFGLGKHILGFTMIKCADPRPPDASERSHSEAE